MAKTQKELGLWYELTPVPAVYYMKDGKQTKWQKDGISREVVEFAWIKLRAEAAIEARLYREEDDVQQYRTPKERRAKAKEELEGLTTEQLWNIGEKYMNRPRR